MTTGGQSGCTGQAFGSFVYVFAVIHLSPANNQTPTSMLESVEYPRQEKYNPSENTPFG
jgi:hypothetical protein